MKSQIQKQQTQATTVVGKKVFSTTLLALACFASSTFAQSIPQSQVPSVIVNNFQKAHPKAFDVEWKLDRDYYKVDFETGLLNLDHDVWYDKSGKVIRHKEEISKSDLPKQVQNAISKNFSGFRVEDVKKTTENNKATYSLDLKKLTEEWKVAFDSDGNVLSKIAD
jgi:hypothetical protein